MYTTIEDELAEIRKLDAVFFEQNKTIIETRSLEFLAMYCDCLIRIDELTIARKNLTQDMPSFGPLLIATEDQAKKIYWLDCETDKHDLRLMQIHELFQ